MTCPYWLLTLALLGGIVALAVGVIAAYAVLATLTFLAEHTFLKAEKAVFYAAGGEAHPDGTGRTPRPPWDRVWVELRYGASIVRWIQTKLGVVNYVNPLERPDLERLYELREENWGESQ